MNGDAMNDEILLIQLRDCFTAGYTLPQFCIDNEIKKPLFIAVDQNRVPFLWEIHVQFCYYRRMKSNFALLNGKISFLNLCPNGNNIANLELKNISEINFAEFDKIIVIDSRRLNPQIENAVYLDWLVNYFVLRTYLEIPLLHFLHNHQGVKFLRLQVPAYMKMNTTPNMKKI